MAFKKWVSIENSYNEKFIKKALEIYPELQNESFVVQEKNDGCLDKYTIILTEDGEKTIGDICENKYKGNILTLNVLTNKVEKEKISNFSIKEKTTEQWYEIELDDGTILKITGNHRIWLPELKCYRKVENLLIGDIILKK
jgi:hypothetical protein